MTDQTLDDFATILVLSGVVPAQLAALTYGLGSPWWRSWLGRIMFGLFSALAVVLGLVILRRLFGDYPGFGTVAVVSYGYLTLVLWAVWVIILVERRKPAPFAVITQRKETINMGDNNHLAVTAAAPKLADWDKRKRAIRTFIQTVLSTITTACGAILALALAAPQLLAELAKVLPEGWVLWLATAIATAGVVAGVITRIMAHPLINGWLVKIGAGTVPSSSVDPGIVEHTS